MDVWSELSSRLGVIFSLFVFSPFVTAILSRWGILLRSDGQYVGLPVDNILRLLFLMNFSWVLPQGVVILDHHSVCFELWSPAAIYLSPKCWKYSFLIYDVILCRGGTYTADNWTWNVIYYELLKPGETVNTERYRQQMIDLNQALRERQPEYQKRQHKVILLHDNTPSHTAKPVKETIEAFSWEIFSRAAYSPDLALYLFIL